MWFADVDAIVVFAVVPGRQPRLDRCGSHRAGTPPLADHGELVFNSGRYSLPTTTTVAALLRPCHSIRGSPQIPQRVLLPSQKPAEPISGGRRIRKRHRSSSRTSWPRCIGRHPARERPRRSRSTTLVLFARLWNKLLRPNQSLRPRIIALR